MKIVSSNFFFNPFAKFVALEEMVPYGIYVDITKCFSINEEFNEHSSVVMEMRYYNFISTPHLKFYYYINYVHMKDTS